MKGEWREAIVADIASPERNALVGGPFGSNLVSDDYLYDGVPVIRGQNMRNCWVDGEFVFVSPTKADSLEANLARPGDIIFTQRGTLGQVSLIPEEPFERYLVSQSQMKLTVNRKRADPLFFYYVFRSQEQQQYILQNAIQTGVPHTNLGMLRNTPVPIPPLSVQRVIGRVLGTLDNKIELNRRMNQTLEGIAGAVFRSWFVDFNAVRARAARQFPLGLNPALAALFPDGLEDTQLGVIPKGWLPSDIRQHFRLTMGQSPPGSTYNATGEGLPFYQGRTDFGFRFPSRRVYCNAPTRLAEAGDTLVSVRAPVGDVNMASERCAVGRGVAAIRHHSSSRSFTYYSMHQLRDHFGKFEAEGTVFGCINKGDFERLPFVVPAPDIIMAFERLVSPLDDRIENGERQILTLVDLRDALLPKLISGGLRISDAERIVGRHA